MSGPTPIDKNDLAGLRRFAFLFAAVITVLFWGILPWLFGFSRSWWPPGISAGLVLLGLVWPRGVYPVYRGWLRVSGVVAAFNNRIILALAFFIMIMPAGMIARALGKLQYREGFDADAQSYRVVRESKPKASDMERPF